MSDFFSSAMDIDKFTAGPNITIVEAMQKIDKNSKGILYIVDENGKLCGSLTDGDIRRRIIKTGNLHDTAGQSMQRNVKYLLTGDSEKAQSVMADKKIRSIPIVDARFHIREIKFKGQQEVAQEHKDALNDTSVIVMAGGKGTRLYPYTKILPKPLIPIGDIPILERILNRFYEYGVTDFYITVNYKKEMIKSYFNEVNPPYNIHFVEETKPLGTAGSIRLIKQNFRKPVFVTNCDILIEAEYDKILKYHTESRDDMTVVSSLRNEVIQYGVLHSKEDGVITSMEEKPHFSYFINTGMYVVNPEYLKEIPEDTFFHMPQLAEKLMNEGCRVGMYPISENSYLDMGQFEEMKKMEKRIQEQESDQ